METVENWTCLEVEYKKVVISKETWRCVEML